MCEGGSVLIIIILRSSNFREAFRLSGLLLASRSVILKLKSQPFNELLSILSMLVVKLAL